MEYQIRSPFYIINDALIPKKEQEQEIEMLERHSDDLYKLLISRLSQFEALPVITKRQADELKILLDDFVSLKALLTE